MSMSMLSPTNWMRQQQEVYTHVSYFQFYFITLVFKSWPIINLWFYIPILVIWCVITPFYRTNDQILPRTPITTNTMQEVEEFQGLNLLRMVVRHETLKWDPSHSVGIDLQSYINNPTLASPFPSNVAFTTLIGFKRTPSLSIGLRPLG